MHLEKIARRFRAPSYEGWEIFHCHRGFEIERDDEMEAFESDDEAVRFVRLRARAGSRVHQIALAIHQRNKRER